MSLSSKTNQMFLAVCDLSGQPQGPPLNFESVDANLQIEQKLCTVSWMDFK